ncbi:hypothetical protein H6G89_19630 [Oscillatoria sp. FACHB-1407]|uniref:hypothetical protein n=1 Tax=Oscillatoria sp. FACHB-1407 TaxID=2692847 RepID=UPI001682BC97|nr:hypothetical protein [Oscillatoria sp. FACHB-1407]MBD2463249.1 hypothetical protein [Oscillatoria sp. FACHB-1407]
MRADAYFLKKERAEINSNVSVQKPFVKSGLTASLSRALGNMVARMAGNSEPQIWQTQGSAGEMLWNVYDPTTDQTSVFYSELEVRTWLDERYNF